MLLSTEKPRVGLIFGGEEGASPLDYQVPRCCREEGWPQAGSGWRQGQSRPPVGRAPRSPTTPPGAYTQSLMPSSLLPIPKVVPNFRIRTIPVLGTMPALFGMAAASWILCQLAGKPFVPEPVFTIEVRAKAATGSD